MSKSTSFTAAVREGTKLWWNSSVTARPAKSSRLITSQPRDKSGREEPIKARATSRAKIAYSTTWADLRIAACRSSTSAGLIPGNSQIIHGWITEAVLSDENCSVEGQKMITTHSTDGP